MKKRIAIFASGSGSNAENIVRYFARQTDLIFPLIVSNNANAYVHERAMKMQIPSVTITKTQLEDPTFLLDLLGRYHIDAIVLAGFLVRIPARIIDAFPNNIINIHPALLPKFGGKGMYGHRVHEAVKAAGETESGITIHFVNENYDEGNVIFQAKCTLAPSDTPQSIAQKVQELEYKFFPQIISKLWL